MSTDPTPPRRRRRPPVLLVVVLLVAALVLADRRGLLGDGTVHGLVQAGTDRAVALGKDLLDDAPGAVLGALGLAPTPASEGGPDGAAGSAADASSAEVYVEVRPGSMPSRSSEEADAPLGTPPVVDPTSDAYAFLGTHDDGTPVTYDPCRPLHWVLNPAGMPAGAEGVVEAAVARVAAATGLVLVFDGETDEVPSADRQAFQPDRYGDRWAPVLVAWVTPEQDPELEGDVAGLGGSTTITYGDELPVYVTGTAELDATQLGEEIARTGSTDVALAVATHELAHVLGLAHVEDESQLMAPQTDPEITDLQAGDRTGLALLGAGACVPAV